MVLQAPRPQSSNQPTHGNSNQESSAQSFTFAQRHIGPNSQDIQKMLKNQKTAN